MEFENKEKFCDWLKGLTKAYALSMAILGSAGTIEYQISSTKNLYQIHSRYDSSFLQEGKYSVEVCEVDDDNLDIEYNDYAVAITFEASLHNSLLGLTIGDKSKLLPELAAYECCFRFDKSNPLGLGHIWIKIPADPQELVALKRMLANHDVIYAFPDGSGALHLGNLKFGGGLS